MNKLVLAFGCCLVFAGGASAALTTGGKTAAAPRKATLSVDEIMTRLDTLDPKKDRNVTEIVESVKVQPVAVAAAVEKRLKEPGKTETQRQAYAVALGIAAQQSSVPALIDLAKTSCSTSALGQTARFELAIIGGDDAGAFLLEDYRKNPPKTDEGRYEPLLSLARMRYAPALKDAEAILHVNPNRFYWQVEFVFGYFDDLAVPLLCDKLNSPDGTVRTNALGALRFIMPPGAASGLLKRYKVEPDPEIRYQIVEALEWTLGGDEVALRKIFGDICAHEKDPRTLKFAGETLAQMAESNMMRAKFKPDATKFKAVWQRLYDGGVHVGMQDAMTLAYSATKADLPALLKLRRRALDRQSDECFYDYKRLTRVIMQVRGWAPDKPPKR